MKIVWIMMIFLALKADEIYATYEITAMQNASLSFEIGGVIEEIFVDVGSVVKKGDLLAKLADDELERLLEVAKNEQELARVTYEFALREHARQAKVKYLLDESTFDRVEEALRRSKAQLDLARSNVALREVQLAKSRMVAPFDGVIYAKNVERGDALSVAASKSVLRIESAGSKKMLISFDQSYWSRVNAGDRFVFAVDGSDEKRGVVLDKIYPQADKNSRKITAEARVDGLKVGFFGDGFIEVK